MAFLAEAGLGRPFTSDSAAADAMSQAIDELSETLGIPRRLSQLGVRADQLPAIVEGSRGNSLSGNPRPVSPEELRDLLEEML